LNNEVMKGEIVRFTASVEVEQGEYLDPDSLVLRLLGPESIECRFNVDGSVIAGCFGISIQQVSVPPYRLGYGYEEGKLIYQIELDSSYFMVGRYDTSLGVVVMYEEFIERGKDVIIKAAGGLEGCSIRAGSGSLIGEGEDFGSGSISFYLPVRDSVGGKGRLSGQKGRDTLIILQMPTYLLIWVPCIYSCNPIWSTKL